MIPYSVIRSQNADSGLPRADKAIDPLFSQEIQRNPSPHSTFEPFFSSIRERRKLSPHFLDRDYVAQNLFRSTKGFQALDLLIAVALAAILFTASLPSLAAMRETQAVKSEALRLKNLISSLSLTALQRESDLSLQFSPGSYRAFEDDAPERAVDSHTYQPATLRIELNNGRGSKISFYRSGVVSPCKVRISNNQKSCVLTVSLRGRVTSSCETENTTVPGN